MVRLTEDLVVAQIGGWGRNFRFYVNTDYEVTRVGSTKVVIRGDHSGWVDISSIVGHENEVVTGVRKLGTPPEDGGDYIKPDDPRLRWLWDDAAAYAKSEGYCPTYDLICAKLGIPGRPRNFTVTGKVDSLEVRTTILAHSPKEAIDTVLEKITSLTGARAVA